MLKVVLFQLLALSPGQIFSQWYLTDLRDTTNQADYIIISPPGYTSVIEPLAAFRATHNNLAVAIVLTDSIYATFGQGISQDTAIKSFFSYALRRWRNPKPEYFLMVGNENTTPSRKEPGLYFPPTFTEDSVRVDHWFVEGIVDSTFPNRVDASIGRFPAWNTQQLQTMVAKTITYETSTDTSWCRRNIHVADSGEVGLYERDNVVLMQTVAPQWTDTQQVHVRVSSSFHRPRSQFFDLVNQGVAILSFWGPMNFYQFSSAGYFTTWDVDSLSNGERLPFCVLISGQRFEKQDTLCMASNLLQSPGKGAIATLAPTGAVYYNPSFNFVRRVFQEMVANPSQPIGETIRAVKNALPGPRDIAKQTLLGDPALVVKHGSVTGALPPEDIPRDFVLHQNFPNPFNPSTTIRFEVPVAGFAILRVYNILGQEVAVLVNGEISPGRYTVTWDAAESSSGVYFYRIQFRSTSDGQVQTFTETKKMLLVR